MLFMQLRTSQRPAKPTRVWVLILMMLTLDSCAKDSIKGNLDLQDQLYFGYGSNLSSAFMKERLKDGDWTDDWHKSGNDPHPIPIDLGCHKLLGYEFGYTFNTEPFGEPGAAANIAAKEGALTYGVVYRITKEHLKELDETEDTPTAYERLKLPVQPCSAAATPVKSFPTWVYVGQKAYLTNQMKPDPAYVRILLEGAEEHKLPADYVDAYLKAK